MCCWKTRCADHCKGCCWKSRWSVLCMSCEHASLAPLVQGDRRSDGFTVSTRGGWSERGGHEGTLAPPAPPFLYIPSLGFFSLKMPVATRSIGKSVVAVRASCLNLRRERFAAKYVRQQRGTETKQQKLFCTATESPASASSLLTPVPTSRDRLICEDDTPHPLHRGSRCPVRLSLELISVVHNSVWRCASRKPTSSPI